VPKERRNISQVPPEKRWELPEPTLPPRSRMYVVARKQWSAESENISLKSKNGLAQIIRSLKTQN
jgi:hypothetical protein